MAVTYPRNDVLSNLGVVSQSFTLVARNALSRQRNGVTIPKVFGSSIWIGEWSSKDKFHDKAIDFEAIINSLGDGLEAFYAYDTRRVMPLAHPSGNFTDSGKILSIHENRKLLAFEELDSGMVLSRGDYFCFTYNTSDVAYHQLMEGGIVGGDGTTSQLEVRPHIRPGAIVGTTAVKFKNPYGRFKLFPGSTAFSTANIQQSNATIQAYQDFL